MSLKFGIYLVEQRIISPEQFCGLVKIQQESTMSMATIALRKNMMTIKQVANVLDLKETSPSKTFIQIAVEEDIVDRTDADELVRAQQSSCAPIRRLVVECGLLTERQSQVLFNHFQRVGTRKPETQPSTTPQTPTTPIAEPAPTRPVSSGADRSGPRRPKFKQRPIVVHPYSNTTTS